LTVDSSGNIYVADSGYSRIRKITPAREVSTFAGNEPGHLDGTGTATKFENPLDVAVDGTGNIYVVDNYNYMIRKIVIDTKAVTTFAGGDFGYENGTGTAAQFAYPSGAAVYGNNIYIADTNNHLIRKIDATNAAVTTFAGYDVAGYADGTGTVARFRNPTGVAVDSSGNIYVADTNNHRIRKITTTGVVTTLAGSSQGTTMDGTGAAARFNSPTDVAVDGSGNVYVADSINNRIRKITPAGVVTTITEAFNKPMNLEVNSAGTIVYVADTNNHRIRILTKQ
jgi:sugar lactone lactonase YvrE